MKKIIYALLLITSLSKSQIIVTGMTLTLMNYSPEKICACDSVNITVKWKYLPPISNPNAVIYTLSYYLFIPSAGTFSYIPTRYFTASNMWAMSKTPNPGGDTLYHFYHQIPCNFVELYSNPGQDKVITILTFGGGTNMYIDVYDCTSGINELSNKETPVQYYDLNGTPIDPRKNELILRKSGNRYVKTIITD